MNSKDIQSDLKIIDKMIERLKVVDFIIYWIDENGGLAEGKRRLSGVIFEYDIIESLIISNVISEDVDLKHFEINGSTISLDFNNDLLKQLDLADKDRQIKIIEAIKQSFIKTYNADSIVLTVENKTIYN